MNFMCGVASKLMRRCDSQMPAQPVIIEDHLNKEPLMKSKLISLSAITPTVIAASSICVIGTIRAQTGAEPGMPLGSNPHLRSQSAAAPDSPGARVKMARKAATLVQRPQGGAQRNEGIGK